MTPGQYMRLGAATGLAACICYIASPDIMWVTLAFGGGMVFGKGYGIMEERE